MDVQGKVVIVTGASGGIGLATARRFAQAGAKVVLIARSADKLASIVDELRQQGHEALALPADMRNKNEVDQMIEAVFQHYGRIDILINNAGQAVAGTVATVSIDDFRQVIDLNIFGALYAIQAAVPRMRHNGGGLIINVSSPVYKWHVPGVGAYASTKAALDVLSETARIELAADNARVITFYPGFTATDFGKHALGRPGDADAPNAYMPTPDSPEQVAEKILEAAQTEPAVLYMHESYANNS